MADAIQVQMARMMQWQARASSVLVAAISVFIEMWHVFQAGRLAFGIWSGLVYASLTWVLPGPFVIPHMVRLDVKRLLDLEPQGDR
jgi:hypothetical protein